MIADLVKVARTARCGWGLFATRAIPRGTLMGFRCVRCAVVCRWPDLLRKPLPERERILEHTYAMNTGEVVLDCSIGRYMNHACAANVLEAAAGFDIAVRWIEPGEEVTCDYRQYHEPGVGDFRCACGAAGCWGFVRSERPAPPALERFWANATEAAARDLRIPGAFLTGVGAATERIPAERTGPGEWRPPLVPAGDPMTGLLPHAALEAAPLPAP